VKTKEVVIVVRVTKEFKKAVENLAAKHNHTMSRYVTDSINERMRGELRGDKCKCDTI
jgi:hypothetical protein